MGLIAVMLSAASVIVSCGESVTATTPEPVFLQVAGAQSMGSLIEDLAVGYAGRAPLVSLEPSSLGTEHGLATLRANQVDMALVSWLPFDLSGWPLLEEVWDPAWQATAIARDGLAIIVHPSNSLDGVGLIQLQDLFGGRTSEWRALGAPALGPVQPVVREDGAGTRAAFEAIVMEDRRVTPLAIVAPSERAVIEYVAEHPGAIGYVSMAAVVPGTKVLAVEGELPTPTTAREGSYPLSRDLWLVTAEPTSETVAEFLAFVLGPAGQEIVGRRYGRVR